MLNASNLRDPNNNYGNQPNERYEDLRPIRNHHGAYASPNGPRKAPFPSPIAHGFRSLRMLALEVVAMSLPMLPMDPFAQAIAMPRARTRPAIASQLTL